MPAIACFDDKKLDQLLKTTPSSLIYVWSPRMVLSVTQAFSVAQVAVAEGLQFVPLLDPRVPFAEAQAALDQHNLSESKSVLNACAHAQSAQFSFEDWHHAPTMRLRIDQRLHGRRIVGAMPAVALRALLHERLAQ